LLEALSIGGSTSIATRNDCPQVFYYTCNDTIYPLDTKPPHRQAIPSYPPGVLSRAIQHGPSFIPSCHESHLLIGVIAYGTGSCTPFVVCVLDITCLSFKTTYPHADAETSRCLRLGSEADHYFAFILRIYPVNLLPQSSLPRRGIHDEQGVFVAGSRRSS
ncbi:hypothetical protein GALMADRAFT_156557, partial [Galerina marginata CBS 339.88]